MDSLEKDEQLRIDLCEILDFYFDPENETCLLWNVTNNGDDEFTLFSYLYFEHLNFCGCGSPEIITNIVVDLMKIIDDKTVENRQSAFADILGTNSDTTYAVSSVILNLLNNHGFLEHGSTIGWSWLTNKGRGFLNLTNEIGLTTPITVLSKNKVIINCKEIEI